MTTILQDIKNIGEEQVKLLEEAFAYGADVRAACYYANISRQTYYNWIASFPELAERFDTLREKTPMLAYKVIHNKLEEGDNDTAKWLLERKRKSEFSTKVESDITKSEVVEFKFIRNDNTDNQTDNQTTDSVG